MKCIRVMMIVFLGVSCVMHAKIVAPRSEKRFDTMLSKHDYVVVTFYQSDKMTKKNKELQGEINQMEKTVKSASKMRFYRDGKVSFGLVNVGQEKLSEVDDNYGVTKLPTVMLFKNGVPVRNKLGQVVTYTGFFNAEVLDKFVQSHWKDDIEERIKQIESDRRYRREVYRYYQPYFYYGYGNPYSFYSPYGHPYRHRGLYHGSHVGIGFHL